ncbi:MAG TPA: prenyltransferase, partial [Aggregatilineales bacterium]|nr:prenyltransferase [Aggregatilineales bacterium]
MSMIRQKLLALVRLSRAYFLFMPVIPYFLGVGLASEPLNSRIMIGGLGIQMLVQLSISYLNDYHDIETDRLNQNRTLLSGGSGELTRGILPPYAAFVTGCILQVIAVVCAWRLGIAAADWLILGIAIFMAHFYTAPPLKLVYRGLGEFAVGVTAAILVPAWGYSLQRESLSWDIVRVG